jgi:hypothetical protein
MRIRLSLLSLWKTGKSCDDSVRHSYLDWMMGVKGTVHKIGLQIMHLEVLHEDLPGEHQQYNYEQFSLEEMQFEDIRQQLL